MQYYKDDFTDFMMHHNKSLPRYAVLARKAISHYLGDQYNPETFDEDIELFFRQLIRNSVKLKVFNKEPYDWVFIDHFFRMVLHDRGYPYITYDMSKIEKGYNGVIRGLLPKHHA